MKRDIKLSAFYPFPPERVWRALTDSKALSTWLMPNDFEPRIGHKFNFKTKPAPGFDGIVYCEVLELNEPVRLAYSWRGGPINTVLSFDLEDVKNGTNLTLQHNGFEGIKAIMVSFMMGSGWKKMFRSTLPSVIENIDDLDKARANKC
jgi:uncharacterized protein YndB with AHSA1/START domain